MNERSELCRLEVELPIATITLNRPEARNALNLDLLHALIQNLTDGLTAGASVLVLRAEGTVFCAGADLRSDDGTRIGHPGLRRELIEGAIKLVRAFPVAIAVVQGPAVGGGWGLAFAADVVLAVNDALFKFPELPLGLLPPEAVVQRFLEVAGPVRAVRLLGSGEPFRADDRALTGLVETTPVDQLAQRSRDLADHFSRSDPALLRALKQQIQFFASAHERLTDG